MDHRWHLANLGPQAARLVGVLAAKMIATGRLSLWVSLSYCHLIDASLPLHAISGVFSQAGSQHSGPHVAQYEDRSQKLHLNSWVVRLESSAAQPPDSR